MGATPVPVGQGVLQATVDSAVAPGVPVRLRTFAGAIRPPHRPGLKQLPLWHGRAVFEMLASSSSASCPCLLLRSFPVNEFRPIRIPSLSKRPNGLGSCLSGQPRVPCVQLICHRCCATSAALITRALGGQRATCRLPLHFSCVSLVALLAQCETCTVRCRANGGGAGGSSIWNRAGGCGSPHTRLRADNPGRGLPSVQVNLQRLLTAGQSRSKPRNWKHRCVGVLGNVGCSFVPLYCPG